MPDEIKGIVSQYMNATITEFVAMDAIVSLLMTSGESFADAVTMARQTLTEAVTEFA